LVEAALILPLLLLLAFGGVGVGRLVQARMALDAATREAARAAVLSPMPHVNSNGDEQRHAQTAGEDRGIEVARQYGLANANVAVTFEPRFAPGGFVIARGTYRVTEIDLPYMRHVFHLHARHDERIDPHRSLLP
jgi:hypothetical protein